jgi:hypothetical protein
VFVHNWLKPTLLHGLFLNDVGLHDPHGVLVCVCGLHDPHGVLVCVCGLHDPHGASLQELSRTELLQQLQQGMAGYPWEPQDWEWRPTWTVSLRHDSRSATTAPGDATAGAVPGSVQAAGSSWSVLATNGSLLDSYAADLRTLNGLPHLTLLSQLTHSLAELEGPQRGIQLLQDQIMLNWYKSAIEQAAIGRGPRGSVVLVLSHGSGGILGLLAAAAPEVEKVVVVEKGRWGYRAASQLLEHNRCSRPETVNKVHLVPVPIHRCRWSGSSSASGLVPGGQVDGGAAAACASTSDDDTLAMASGRQSLQSNWLYYIERAADILVTDLFDYRCVA